MLVRDEERISHDALHKLGLFISLVLDAWGNNASGYHKYIFTSAVETAQMKGLFTRIVFSRRYVELNVLWNYFAM